MDAQEIGERLLADRESHQEDHALARPDEPPLEELPFDDLDQVLAMLHVAGEVDRAHSPQELDPSRDLRVGGEDEGRHDRAIARQPAGGEAALGEGDDAAAVELARRVHGGGGDDVGDLDRAAGRSMLFGRLQGLQGTWRGRRESAGRERRIARYFAALKGLELVDLGLDDDLRHRTHRFGGEAPGRRLARQHQRVGAVEDGVRHVRGLGARRTWLDHHRLEHLGRDDDRFPQPASGRDDALLQHRNLVQRHFDAEVAARHHDGVGRRDDLVDVLDRRCALELGDDRNRRAVGRHDRPDRRDVSRPADVARGDVVGALFDGEGDVRGVLLRDREGELRIGQVDSLAGRDRAAVDDPGRDRSAAFGDDLELHQAVVDEDALADPQVVQEVGVVDRQVDARRWLAQGQALPGAEQPGPAGDLAEPVAWAHEIEQDRNLETARPRHLAHQPDRPAVGLLGAVGEVETQDVGARGEQPAEHALVGGRRSERGYDLGASFHERPRQHRSQRRIARSGIFHGMFEGLQDKFQEVFRRLKGEGRITEEHLAAALKQIRLALLEADVHFRVVKEFLARVEEKALGGKVLESLSPAQQVIKIVHDELTATLGGEDARELKMDGAPAVLLMCGLQGSGKTTTCGKLARRLAARGRYPLLVAADLQRAAAVEQLVQVGARVDIPVLRPEPGESVVALAQRSLREARERGRDVVILDTAGRLHVDQELMAEIAKIAATVSPDEVLYVADSMTGQDAVRSAQEFARVLPLTGVLLTKLDGDARGGAALSVRAVAQVPIRFVGVGEKPEDLELFSPARMASRILGMGDVMALIEKAQETVDAKEAQRLAERLSRNEFTLEDLRDQLRQVKKLGSLKSVLGMLPKMGGLKGLGDVSEADEKRLSHTEAIINAMTLEERRTPGLLNASRKKRVARGSGTSVQEINQLIKQYLQMKRMMKGVKSGWMKKAFGGGLPAGLGGPGGPGATLGGRRNR